MVNLPEGPRSPDRVERRSDSRIVRAALDEVKAIQTLLADVYKDVGDGRTLVRELVQNADDAEAERLVFVIVDQGWPDAQNSLLRGPALLVANDGPFPGKDWDALHQALGGSKADDAGKVGCFGIGLKSVFHICEAIVYVGAEAGVRRPGALNPWAGTGAQGDSDPLHPDWDSVGDEDLERLLEAARMLLGTFDDGLVLWIPLRRTVHLDRAQDRQYGLGQVCPPPEGVAGWFGRPASLALLLAQCGHLGSIEADRSSDPQTLSTRTTLALVVRPAFHRRAWVGRHDDDTKIPDRPFRGRIQSGKKAWSVVGVEALGLDSLRKLRAEPAWPTDPHWRGGRSVWVSRKALAHAAITVLRPDEVRDDRCGARIRWAVFFPLDDDPSPRSSARVEAVGSALAQDAWDIVMHGYFWPSQDRRSIPGVTDDDAGAGDSAVRIRWNRAVRDELLLPLLPGALADAVQGIPEDAARLLLRSVADSRTVQRHLAAVTLRYLLLPAVAEDGVCWKIHPADRVRILSIPKWTEAPLSVREQFAAREKPRDDDVVFVDDDAPRLGGEAGPWSLEWVECILSCISSEVLRSPAELAWVEALIIHVLGSPADSEDDRSAAAARWLASRISEGVLSSTTDGAFNEAQAEVRAAWRRVFATLPDVWLVNAPVATQRALVELASGGAVGAGLLPIPLGRRTEVDRSPRPDAACLDGALLHLGKRLRDGEDTQRAHRSRLLLAETLLSVREAVPLGEELSRLPLLRARRLPDDRDESWSIADLRRRADQHRVFARPGTEDEDDPSALEVPSDPKQAAKDLAEAVGANVWLVSGSVASTVTVLIPTTAALAQAVLSSKEIQSKPTERIGLLRRLTKPEDVDDPVVRRAIRTLLTGRVPALEDEHALYYVRRRDTERVANCESLRILLRVVDRSWYAVEPDLVELLTHALLENLNIKAVDQGVLHDLLHECLDQPTRWSELGREEVLHLLRHLHGTSPEKRVHWREMPLHRGVGGGRGSFDDRALRAIGALRLPPELESEIRLLEPDEEVTALYLDVPTLDDDGILHAMLVSQRPQQFADQIIRALYSDGESRVVLPRNPALLNLLQDAAWLPLRDSRAGVAPRKILVLPDELQASVIPLRRAGALGDHRLPDDANPEQWRAAEKIVHELLRRPTPSRQVQRLAAAIDQSKVAGVEGGAYSLLPAAAQVDAALIDDAIHSSLADAQPGWALVRAAANAVGADSAKPLGGAPASAQDAVVGIARSLCSAVPHARQISALLVLAAARPAKDSPAGRLFRCLMEVFTRTDGFFDNVLPSIELPTQDGQWHFARDVARSASGVARRHRVLADLRSPLRLDNDQPIREEAAAEDQIGSSTAEALAKYFKPWADRLPNGAVAAFLSLLGNGKDQAIMCLSQQWLGEDVSVDGMRRALYREGEEVPCESVKAVVSGFVSKGQRVKALNLLGERAEMEAGTDDDTIFTADPVRRYSALGDWWEINLRDVGPHGRTTHELIELLRGTTEWWAVRALRLDLHSVRSWWSRWGTGSQAQIGPVQASILAHLPLTLHQLDVRERAALKDALREAQRAQRMREQAPEAQLRKAIEIERSALDHLARLVRDEPEHQRFIWGRVQALIERFGYRADSVLLELAQNADDALSQSAQIAGSPLPPAARRLVVRVAEHDGVPTVDVVHYGRPINDTGGASFPAGREFQWDQDLYFMMLLNLSSKPGETPGQSTATSTTGRFGLGFKSVHLVSETPSVVSGFLAFSIAGGLLPIEQPVPDDPDLLPADGHRATRVRLPLRGDVEASELIDRMFRRFANARTLLPAFAREIREVVVDGGPYAGISSFDGEPIDRAPGWSVAKGTVALPGHGQWRLLRFRPAGAMEGSSTAAIVIGLVDRVPKQFPPDLPFLWNVTPTSESWGCGYAVNGPFKLDPGRTHVSLDDSDTLQVVELLGVALGKGLVELHDALVFGADGAASNLPVREAAAGFLGSLWAVLASGIDSRDELRRQLLLRIQGPDRGVSMWMRSRSVVPSGLPAPFSDRLPALMADTRIEVAEGGLESPGLCSAIAKVNDIASLAQKHHVVSSEVAQLLRPLLRTAPRQLRPSDILRELAELWNHVLTPERLRALNPLAEEEVWKAIADVKQVPPWSAKLLAHSAAGDLVSLRGLLLPRGLTLERANADIEDELRRAAFAPDERVLDPAYIGRADDLTLFLQLRLRHEIDAATMASWYADLTPDRRPEGLRYLVEGRLQREVLERLVAPDARPNWLKEYNDVRLMLEVLGKDQWQTRALLAALFSDRFQPAPEAPPPAPVLSQSKRRNFFECLEEWWSDPSVRLSVIESYEQESWPDWLRRAGIADGLQADSPDHWLALLVLGACRSLGRARSAHHRAFLEQAHQEGWWEVFKNPYDTLAWMEILRSWQDGAVGSLTYPRWMSLFPAIYQLSRYRDKYRRLLLSAGRRSADLYRVECLLAPRVDEALTGAGQHFDAPPAPLGMGLHWVLRELVRLRVLDGDHIFPDCWVPSEQVLRFLRPLGLESPDSNLLNSEKAKTVFAFLASELKTATPNLHRAFDVPLRHVDANADLRRRLGLEN